MSDQQITTPEPQADDIFAGLSDLEEFAAKAAKADPDAEDALAGMGEGEEEGGDDKDKGKGKKRCPHCQKYLAKSALFCHLCGGEVAKAAPAARVVEPSGEGDDDQVFVDATPLIQDLTKSLQGVAGQVAEIHRVLGKLAGSHVETAKGFHKALQQVDEQLAAIGAQPAGRKSVLDVFQKGGSPATSAVTGGNGGQPAATVTSGEIMAKALAAQEDGKLDSSDIAVLNHITNEVERAGGDMSQVPTLFAYHTHRRLPIELH